MNKTTRLDVYASGMAIFAMFFGAGNIIFPLAIAQVALDKTFYALLGLLITAVAMPFAGLIAMFLYHGNIRNFFDKIGRIPGLLLACFTISLLGPLGCAPRCIILAYSTFSMTFSGISLPAFSAICCAIVFLFTLNRGKFLSLIGYVLSPFKIILLTSIIVIGFLYFPEMHTMVTNQSKGSLLLYGLKEGYNTLDLIGSFFFAPVIITSLAGKNVKPGLSNFILKASGIGAFLLASMYVGFCFLAYIYASDLVGISSDRLLAAIALKVLGPWGGLMVGITVAFACLTTAIALVAAFANFVQKELFRDKIGYIPVILGSIFLTFIMTTLDFGGITAFLTPVLEMCYPVLIFLTAYNIVLHFVSTGKKKESIPAPV